MGHMFYEGSVKGVITACNAGFSLKDTRGGVALSREREWWGAVAGQGEGHAACSHENQCQEGLAGPLGEAE